MSSDAGDELLRRGQARERRRLGEPVSQHGDGGDSLFERDGVIGQLSPEFLSLALERLLVVEEQLHIRDFLASLAEFGFDRRLGAQILRHLLQRTLHLRHLPARVRDFLVALPRLGLHRVVQSLLHRLEGFFALGQHRLQTGEFGVHSSQLRVVSLRRFLELRREIRDARLELSLGGAQRLLPGELSVELAVFTFQFFTQGGSLRASLVDLELQRRVHDGRRGLRRRRRRRRQLALARELGHLRVGALEGLEGRLLSHQSLGELRHLGSELSRLAAGWASLGATLVLVTPAAAPAGCAVVREIALLLAASALELVRLDLLPKGRLERRPHALRGFSLAFASFGARPGVLHRLSSLVGVRFEPSDSVRRVGQRLRFFTPKPPELLLALGERRLGLLGEDP